MRSKIAKKLLNEMSEEHKKKVDDDADKLVLSNVSTRTWYFLGGAGKSWFKIPIKAPDRDTAIARFENNYPDKKWGMITCYD